MDFQRTEPRSAGPVGRRRLAPVVLCVAGAPMLLGLWSWGIAPRILGGSTGPGPLETTATANAPQPGQPSVEQADVPGPAGNVSLASHESKASGDSAAGAPESLEQRVAGEWEDHYQGYRRLIVREDGTATMIVEPTGIGRKLFAERLQFDIEWTCSEDRIVMTTTGGEPKSKTQLVMKLYGTRAEYRLLKLDDQQLLLLDADGKTQYDWRRLSSGNAVVE